MDREKPQDNPTWLGSLISPSAAPNYEGSVFDQSLFEQIAKQFSIDDNVIKNQLILALLYAERYYSLEEDQLALSKSSTKLRRQLKPIQTAADKLRHLLLDLADGKRKTEVLRFHMERAAANLISSPELRDKNPLSHSTAESNEPVYSSPGFRQIALQLDYLLLLIEIADDSLPPGSSGAKQKSSIRLLISPLSYFWTSVLGKKATAHKDNDIATSEFEYFLEVCTGYIAPKRWNEVLSAHRHPLPGDN
ncbi:MAG: hypothetical protein V7741_09855 [Hyphomonas sp.]